MRNWKFDEPLLFYSGESGFSDERDEETDEEDERTRPISSRKRADKNSILKVFQESESVDTSPDEEKTEVSLRVCKYFLSLY